MKHIKQDKMKNRSKFFALLVLVAMILVPFLGTEAHPPTKAYSRYDIRRYAEASNHEQTIRKILASMPEMRTSADIDRYIRKRAPRSPVTGKMVAINANRYKVSVYMMLALMQLDSQFGTTGKGARSKNPGNIGTYGRKVRHYHSWDDGVRAVAKWLAKHKRR